MTKKVRKVLTVILSLGVVVGLAGGLWSTVTHKKGAEAYAEAEALAGIAHQEPEPVIEEIPIDPIALELAQTNLAALREVNEDVVGWISIPETELSYPILQGEDNDYYLNHTWQGDWSSVGSIFMECQVNPDFSEFNTIIYGHKMRNGSMFGSLKYYDEIAHWEAHPSIYIVNDSGVHRYDIFAAHEADTEAITFGLGISGWRTKREFIELSLEQSEIDTGVVPNIREQILTLSTCTGRGYSTRWVVQAVLRDSVLAPSE